MPTIEGTPDARAAQVAVVVSRFNPEVTEGLLRGARAELTEGGATDDTITVVRVPGALELSLAARHLAQGGHYDAVVVLGAVIRGETDHYDFVCSQATRSCAAVCDETGVSVGFGLLTCGTLAHAVARSRDDAKNKGREATRAALEMVDLLHRLDGAVS